MTNSSDKRPLERLWLTALRQTQESVPASVLPVPDSTEARLLLMAELSDAAGPDRLSIDPQPIRGDRFLL